MSKESPVFGAGLGNYDVALDPLISRLDPRLAMEERDQGWNMLAYALGTLGWVGLGLFLLLLAASVPPAERSFSCRRSPTALCSARPSGCFSPW